MIQDLKEIEELLNDIDGKHIGFFDVKSELKDLVKKVQTQALSIDSVSSNEVKLKFNEFANKQQDLDSEFVKIVNDNFWDLL